MRVRALPEPGPDAEIRKPLERVRIGDRDWCRVETEAHAVERAGRRGIEASAGQQRAMNFHLSAKAAAQIAAARPTDTAIAPRAPWLCTK